jgi:hypothetical protein
MEPITIAPNDEIHVVIDGHTISVRHDSYLGAHGLRLGGVDCDLEGDEPGLYIPQPLGHVAS